MNKNVASNRFPLSGKMVGTLIVGCAVLLGLIIFSSIHHARKRVELEGEIARLKQESKAASTENDAPEKHLLPADQKRLADNRADNEEGSSQQDAEWVASEALKEAVAEQRERVMRTISKNINNPGMNQMIEKQQRVLVLDQYRDLVTAFGLNDEESGYFLDLLTARKMLQVDMGMKLMAGVLSKEERLAMAKTVDAGMEEINREIGYFLNNADDSEYFRYYGKTEGERAAVGGLKVELERNGMPMGDDVDEQLVAIMHEAMQNHSFSVQFEENGQPDFSRFTEENIEQFMQEMKTLQDPIVQRASGVLAFDQLPLLEKAFGHYVTAQEQQLRMVQQLFNPL